MRVLFIPSWYPSDKNPFAGAFIQDLANELVSNDIEIEVIATHQHFKKIQSKSSKSELRQDVKVHHLFGWTPPKISKRLQEIWLEACSKRIAQIVDFSTIDIIHAQDYVGFFLASRLAKQYDKPLICTLHHSDFLMDLIPTWRKLILTDILPSTECCIVPSKAMATAILSQNYLEEDQLKVIPNYVKTDKIKSKEILGESPQKFIMVSSSEAVKRPELAIDWMKVLPGQLDIFGSVPNRRRLEKLIEKNGLKDRVMLCGVLPHDQLLRKYSTYDAYISTSSHETFGISIVEALAAGIPALVSSRTGPLDYIDDQTGMMIDQVEDLHQFVENYQHYHAGKIREKIHSLYDVSRVIPQHLSLYRIIYARRCVV